MQKTKLKAGTGILYVLLFHFINLVMKFAVYTTRFHNINTVK